MRGSDINPRPRRAAAHRGPQLGLALLEDEVAEGLGRRRQQLGQQVHDVPAAHHRRALDLDQRQQPGAQLQPDGVQRQEGQAHAGHHGLLDGLVARHLHLHARLKPVLAEEGLHRAARAGALLADDERVGRQRLGRRMAEAQQRMVRGARRRPAGAPRRARRAWPSPCGGRPITARSHSLACSSASSCSRFCETCSRTSMPGCSCAEARQQPGHEVLGGADDADREQARLQPLEARHRVVGILQRGQQALARRPGSTRRRWSATPARPLRSNSGRPTCASSSLICMVTAGGLRCSASAARAKLSCRATSVKTLSCRKVTFLIQGNVKSKPRRIEFLLVQWERIVGFLTRQFGVIRPSSRSRP